MDIENPLAFPQIIPFGGGVILLGDAVSPEVSAIVIRACRDDFTADSGNTPAEAWEASKGAPEWWLTFTDPNDAVGLADKLNELADAMLAARGPQ